MSPGVEKHLSLAAYGVSQLPSKWVFFAKLEEEQAEGQEKEELARCALKAWIFKP